MLKIAERKTMLHQRHVSRVVTVPPLAPGFVGPGHMAAPVLSSEDFAANDPFILLMDDHLDIGDRRIGGPHPHAGFETVTLILEGEIYDRDEGGILKAGEVQWMTAGRGIIHGENIYTKGRVRLLQLWLVLPKAKRWTEPGYQVIHSESIRLRREPGIEVRLYSGSSGGLRSDTGNHVPVTITEMKMETKASVDQDLPLSYNGFVFVINGSVEIAGTLVQSGQVGFLDQLNQEGESILRVTAGEGGARLVMYAGQAQHDEIVSHGPFIGDSKEDIVRLFREYQAGKFVRMSELAKQHA